MRRDLLRAFGVHVCKGCGDLADGVRCEPCAEEVGSWRLLSTVVFVGLVCAFFLGMASS